MSSPGSGPFAPFDTELERLEHDLRRTLRSRVQHADRYCDALGRLNTALEAGDLDRLRAYDSLLDSGYPW